jgi:hypothetical protein
LLPTGRLPYTGHSIFGYIIGQILTIKVAAAVIVAEKKLQKFLLTPDLLDHGTPSTLVAFEFVSPHYY